MKRVLFAIALGIGSAAVAEQPRPVTATGHSAQTGQDRESRLAMRERMGQLQLDLLVSSIVRADDQARNDPRSADQALASNAR